MGTGSGFLVRPELFEIIATGIPIEAASMHTVEAEDTTKDALVSNFSMLSSEKKIYHSLKLAPNP